MAGFSANILQNYMANNYTNQNSNKQNSFSFKMQTSSGNNFTYTIAENNDVYNTDKAFVPFSTGQKFTLSYDGDRISEQDKKEVMQSFGRLNPQIESYLDKMIESQPPEQEEIDEKVNELQDSLITPKSSEQRSFMQDLIKEQFNKNYDIKDNISEARFDTHQALLRGLISNLQSLRNLSV